MLHGIAKMNDQWNYEGNMTDFVVIIVPTDDLEPLYVSKWHEQEFKLTKFGCCIMISTGMVHTDQQGQTEGFNWCLNGHIYHIPGGNIQVWLLSW